MKRKNIKYILSVAVLVLIAGFTLKILLKDVTISEIVETVAQINPIFVVLCALMVVIYILFEGLGVRTALSSFGQRVKVKKAFAYSNVDFYFSLITPSSTGGQPLMAYYMNKDGIAYPVSTPAILINTICFKLVLIMLGIFVILLMPGLIFGNGALAVVLFFVGVVINLFLISVCFLSMFSQNVVRKITGGFIKLLSKIRIIKNSENAHALLEKCLSDYAECTAHIKKNKSIFVKIFILNLVQRLALFSIAYFVYIGLGFNSLCYFEIIGIQAAIAISVNSLPVPGAAGVTEVVFAILYSSIYPDDGILVSALLLTRIFDYYFALLLSGTVTLINHFTTSGKSRKRGLKT